MKRAIKAALALLVCIGIGAPAQDAQAQMGDDLYVYGFFQTTGRYASERGLTSPDEMSSFALNQLNTFFAKQFTPSFSSFVNLEFTNNFSSENGWGSFRLEEAWMRYNKSSKLNVKVGLLVPEFNNLNTIKNRTPLLAYAFRPLAYETTYSSILPIEALVPSKAFVQLYGALPLGGVRFDYAAYVGNSESSYITDSAVGTLPSGMDTRVGKMVGGRVGARWRSLKVGVSGTREMAKMRVSGVGDAVTLPDLGEAPRTRIGIDASFFRGPLFAEAEWINVTHSLDDGQLATLAALNQGNLQQLIVEYMTTGAITSPLLPGNLVGKSLNLSFWYGLIGVNATESLSFYGMVNNVKDESNFLQASVNMYSAGLSFRPIDAVALKAQYGRVQSPSDLAITVPAIVDGVPVIGGDGMPVMVEQDMSYVNNSFVLAASVFF